MTSKITDLYVNTLKELAVEGVALKQKIQTAKTKFKKDYYKKKVKQNSMKAAQLLVELEQISPSKPQEKGDEPNATHVAEQS